MLEQMLNSPGERKVIDMTIAETGRRILSILESVDAADMLRNQDQKSLKEISNSTLRVLQLKEACCSEVYARLCAVMSGGVSHLSMDMDFHV